MEADGQSGKAVSTEQDEPEEQPAIYPRHTPRHVPATSFDLLEIRGPNARPTCE